MTYACRYRSANSRGLSTSIPRKPDTFTRCLSPLMIVLHLADSAQAKNLSVFVEYLLRNSQNEPALRLSCFRMLSGMTTCPLDDIFVVATSAIPSPLRDILLVRSYPGRSGRARELQMGSPRGLPHELKKTDFPNTLPVISHKGKPIKQGLLRDQLEKESGSDDGGSPEALQMNRKSCTSGQRGVQSSFVTDTRAHLSLLRNWFVSSISNQSGSNSPPSHSTVSSYSGSPSSFRMFSMS